MMLFHFGQVKSTLTAIAMLNIGKEFAGHVGGLLESIVVLVLMLLAVAVFAAILSFGSSLVLSALGEKVIGGEGGKIVETFAAGVAVPLFFISIVLLVFEWQTLLSFVYFYAGAVYGLGLLYVLALTVSFAVRTVHFYRTPNIERAHMKPGGDLDLDAIARDAPSIEGSLKRTAWVTDNYALRAAQALNGLREVNSGRGATTEPERPTFAPERRSAAEAAVGFMRVYADYIREAIIYTRKRSYDKTRKRLERELTD